MTAVDPAAASIEMARRKPWADRVRWLVGDATSLPVLQQVDLVTMTGNVAQVFLTDEEWNRASRALARCDPGACWCSRCVIRRGRTGGSGPGTVLQASVVPEIGAVDSWVELAAVQRPMSRPLDIRLRGRRG